MLMDQPDKKGAMFISLVELSYEDEPETSEELLQLINNPPNRPTRQTPLTLRVDVIEKIYQHPMFNDLSEICTIEGEIIQVDESYQSLNKRVLVAAGQEPDTTWTEHTSDDGLATIRTYNN